MITRRLLLIALVACSGMQTMMYASDAPKGKSAQTETWTGWYKRNKVLVGAATGLMVSIANRPLYTDSVDVLIATYLTLVGSAAGKMNVFTGYICGIVSGLLFAGPHGKNSIMTALLGGVAGAITHGLYNSHQSEEDKSSKE